MRYDDKADVVRLTSGREIVAYGGVIGIALDDDGQTIYSGSDSGEYTEHWTREERFELANEMIARWRAWRDRP